MGKTKAIIIGIENYRNSLTSVRYALNDVKKIRHLLTDSFKVEESDILLLRNEFASRTAILDEVRYHILQLKPDDRFIFYYVGHGFYLEGENWLTAWDTSLDFIKNSSISVREFILEPLSKSNCNKSILFFDTCSENIGINSRGLVHPFDVSGIDSKYALIFLSCSPGEKSYSDDGLKNGIWTYYLVKCLMGEYREAIDSDGNVTNTGLQKVLSKKVSKHVSLNSEIKGNQTPYYIWHFQKSIPIHNPTFVSPEYEIFLSSADYERRDEIGSIDLNNIVQAFYFEVPSILYFDIEKEKELIVKRLEKVVSVNNAYVNTWKSVFDQNGYMEMGEDEQLVIDAKYKDLLPKLYNEFDLPKKVYFGDITFIQPHQIEFWNETLIDWIEGICFSDLLIDALIDLETDHDLDQLYIFFGLPNKMVNNNIYYSYLYGKIHEIGSRNHA